jgi:integrase
MGQPRAARLAPWISPGRPAERLAGIRDERLLAAMLAGKTDITDELVFPGKDGKPMTAETIGKRFINPALAKAGLRRYVIHDLRHTYGSILVQSGAPLRGANGGQSCKIRNPAATPRF